MHYEVELYKYDEVKGNLEYTYETESYEKAIEMSQAWERAATNNEAIIYKVG